MSTYTINGMRCIHKDDWGRELRVGMEVVIGGTTIPWAEYSGKIGTVHEIDGEWISVEVPGIRRLYVTTGYNLYIRSRWWPGDESYTVEAPGRIITCPLTTYHRAKATAQEEANKAMAPVRLTSGFPNVRGHLEEWIKPHYWRLFFAPDELAA